MSVRAVCETTKELLGMARPPRGGLAPLGGGGGGGRGVPPTLGLISM